MTRKQIITLLILTVIFFLLGQFEYENLYRLTLYTVRTLSSRPISFYGKFPFWFGDERFSLIIASIPLTIFMTSKILGVTKQSLFASILAYSFYFTGSFVFICIWTGLNFHVSNDFYHGEEIKKNLRAVNINQTFLATIILTTILTCLTFYMFRLIKWLWLKKLHKKT